ncbi:MAG TPA: site-specific DNA-methyltransferase [Polyangiaceae bacterium]|jgi:adenine-specific DNA-methyltransferase|nr:site-specific DNA-methyltransferase [Polyangiaceae bacterium]
MSNLLVRGDNVGVMRAHRAAWAERFRCAYLDPPFNTGRRFAEYDDATAPRDWAARMRETLEVLAPLVARDGTIACEIDDTELGALIEIGDRVFRRENRFAIVTVVRSAATGHKAINRGPVNVTDYIVMWARDKRALRLNAIGRARSSYDAAYRTWLENPDDPHEAWTFAPLGGVVAAKLGHAGTRAARTALGGEAFERELARFAMKHARHVIRFAQPRFEAIGKDARELVVRSRMTPDKVFRLTRRDHKDFIVRGGNRILCLADKVREIDGELALIEPLTNVWDDIGFQGIAREGGVVFSRNKKPERLLQRILEMTTNAGDWVLDPFAGSGTTAAVAHKMGRRWVTIERERELFARANERLERVVRGEDDTGITRACGWKSGGSFEVADRESAAARSRSAKS